MKTILLSTFALINLGLNAQINDLTISSSQNAVLPGDSVNIIASNSQLGFTYVLRNDSDNSFIGDPIQGTGGDIVFNTGAINNITTYNVYGSNAFLLEFNHQSDRIDLTNDNRGITTEVTLAAMVKPSILGGTRNIILKYGAGDAGYILRIKADGKAYIEGRDGTNTFKSSGPSTTFLVDGQWHYVVGTANLTTGEWKIYVDGTLQNTASTGAGNSMANAHPLYIGNTFSSSVAFNGKIKDVTMWNTELTASDILANSNDCISGTENAVVAHYPLTEGQDTIINDYSSLDIEGTAYLSSQAVSGWLSELSSCRDTLEMTTKKTIYISAVGINETSDIQSLVEIYPNPTTGQLNFKTNIQINTIEIYNLAGQKVLSFNNTSSININELTNGIYMAKIFTTNGNIVTHKIIKK